MLSWPDAKPKIGNITDESSYLQVDGPFHLKSFLNMAGPDVISVGAGPEAQSVLKRMEREATHR